MKEYMEKGDNDLFSQLPDGFHDSRILRTSEEWSKEDPSVIILDPDGWDRQNFQFSWYEEKITLAEFLRRRMISTIKEIGEK